jgi:hypothetical protein
MNCKICGVEIRAPKKSYCGKECAVRGNHNNALAAYERITPTERSCIYCNALFAVSRNRKICGAEACKRYLKQAQNRRYNVRYMQEDYAVYIAKQREYKRRYQNRLANAA